MLSKAKLLPLLLLMFTLTANAQEFGGNPPSVKWDQVNTPEVKVIFRRGIDSSGRRVADIIRRINASTAPTIGPKLKPVSILLQDQNTISNAYVGLAPFRSEFYLTAPQNSFMIGSMNWVDQLAIHEYRHVQQYNNFNVGFSRVLSTLFGQGGQALGNALSVPDWFFEGDAVYSETLVSQQGRGRIPFFFNGYRALWAANKNYSYMKLRNGSYKDYVPNHYPLGYMLVGHGREKYGNDAWRKITYDAAWFKRPFYPFQYAVKKHTGASFSSFTNDALTSFKQKFNDAPEVGVAKNQHFIADEEYPAFTGDSAIIYVKSTYKERPVFMERKDGNEREIRIRDVSIDNHFSCSNGKIVYAAYNIDPRWGYITYSDLRLLDATTGEQKTLTTKTRYFSPDISADSKKIVAVETATSGKSKLHILDDSGKLLSVIPTTENVFFTYPKFYGDDKVVSAVRQDDGKMYIALIDIASGKMDKLHSSAVAGFLTVKDNTVYFTASTSTDDLYAYEIVNRKLYKLNGDALRKGIGSYQPTVGNGKLAWTSFTAYGYRLQKTDMNAVQRTEVSTSDTGPLSNYDINSLDKDSATNVLATVTDSSLPITKYSKGYGLFNFHSLFPTVDDPNYAVSIEGQNVLNTFQSSLLFNYNRNEGYKRAGFSGVYGGLYPQIIGAVNYIMDRRGYSVRNNTAVYWNEFESQLGARIPLNFINGTHLTNISFGSDVVYNRTSFQQAYRSLFADRAYTYLNNVFSITNRVSQARQNIYPKFAQTLSVSYKTTVIGSQGYQWLTTGAIYLPGLAANHSLSFTGAYQERNRNNVISFSNNFPFSRGYQAENLYRLKKAGVNYHFPIAYPDAGLANTVYLSRLRANLYFDYTQANDFYTNGTDFKGTFRTVGAELYFDTKWFNQAAITFGIRYAHLLDNDLFSTNRSSDRIELIIPLTIF
ncbi:hypothetical protein GCM10028827_14920 [Mucilaginibacter myungsuensis]